MNTSNGSAGAAKRTWTPTSPVSKVSGRSVILDKVDPEDPGRRSTMNHRANLNIEQFWENYKHEKAAASQQEDSSHAHKRAPAAAAAGGTGTEPLVIQSAGRRIDHHSVEIITKEQREVVKAQMLKSSVYFGGDNPFRVPAEAENIGRPKSRMVAAHGDASGTQSMANAGKSPYRS